MIDKSVLSPKLLKFNTDDIISTVLNYNILSDAEIAIVILSWLSNGHKNEYEKFEYTIKILMSNKPTKFVLDYRCVEEVDNSSYFKIITNNNFNNLICKIQNIIKEKKNLKDIYDMYMSSKSYLCKYPHDALILMLSEGTGFPTINSSGTFYRYNFMFYLLTYKLNLWKDCDLTNALLPCNDKIFLNAIKKGITKKHLNSTLNSVIILTNIAKKIFGVKNFYKMFDILNTND